MALLTSPRKQIVPLASGDDRPTQRRRRDQPAFTRRVFFCSVVVENPPDGLEYPPELQDFVAMFGDPLDLDGDSSHPDGLSGISADIAQAGNDPQARSRPNSMYSQASSSYQPPNSSQPSLPLTKPSSGVALQDVINELVSTERSYVQRLRTLRDDYAKPLREYAKNKDTLIIPLYEAKTLFGNVDQIVPVNEAFLEDLEKMVVPGGRETVGGVGDVALKHFKHLRGFELYRQYYSKREEAQKIFEAEIKKGSGLSTFIDRIKYATADARTRNRVGLRELLMEPVQRIPRYTLLFREMMKNMAASDPQFAKLAEAIEYASRIAQAKPDDETHRASIMYAFTQTIEDFPANIMSSGRRFVDCIDVEDVIVPHSHHERTVSEPVTPRSSDGLLHCSLLLFDDKLVILKRPNSDKGVRALACLDEIERLTKNPALLHSLRKTGMQYKGMIDLTEVVVTDVGGADFHLYLEVPPINDSERWSSRPFRAMSVVRPPSPINLDPARTEADKRRFLENLWIAQARYRTRAGQSVVVQAEDLTLEEAKGRTQIARTYFNIYQRTAFLQEPKKTKIVVQIDPQGTNDPIPFGMGGPPYVLVRVQPMMGELSRYVVSSNNPFAPVDEVPPGEEDIVQSSRVPDRIIQTIHSFGLYQFRTGNTSAPSTPSSSMRSRAAIFGLDAISRNLFHARPGSSKGDRDVFGPGGAILNTHARNLSAPQPVPPGVRRSKTSGSSRDSVHTMQSASSVDSSSLSRFTRSRSNSTTTTSLHDSSMSSRNSRSSRRSGSLQKAKKLIKRKIPPNSGDEGGGVGAGSESEMERSASRMSGADGQFGRLSGEFETDYSDYYEEVEQPGPPQKVVDGSERDLIARLELAKRNSRNQHEAQPQKDDVHVEGTIHEVEDGTPIPNDNDWAAAHNGRPDSRASHASRDRDLPLEPPNRQASMSSTVRASSTTPTKASDRGEGSSRARALSQPMERHKLHGPRTPSRSPRATTVPLPALDDEVVDDAGYAHTALLTATPRRFPHSSRSSTHSSSTGHSSTHSKGHSHSSVHSSHSSNHSSATSLPRSKRQPFEVSSHSEETPRPQSTAPPDDGVQAQSVEPLVIRRKSSMQFHGKRKQHHVGQRIPSKSGLRRTSSSLKHAKSFASASGPTAAPSEAEEEARRLLDLMQDSRAQIESARSKLQGMRREFERLSVSQEGSLATSPSASILVSPTARPTKTPPRPMSQQMKTREAQERMEEMHRLLKHRPKLSGSNADATGITRPESPAPVRSPIQIPARGTTPAPLEDLSFQVDQELRKALQNHEDTKVGIRTLAEMLITQSAELAHAKAEVNQLKIQKEVLTQLYQDEKDEKDQIYISFNEELETAFQTTQLPQDESYLAVVEEMRQALLRAKAYEQDKALAEFELARANAEKEELMSLLRAHGLLP